LKVGRDVVKLAGRLRGGGIGFIFSFENFNGVYFKLGDSEIN